MSKINKIYLIIVFILASLPNGFVKASDIPSKNNLPSFAPNLVNDPSFEIAGTSPSVYWSLGSTTFGLPTCTFAECGGGNGTAGPRSGSVWVWFGGTTAPAEFATASQAVNFPVGVATLQFYFWIGSAQPGSDTNDNFTVVIDGITVFSANATQQSLYSTYKAIDIDVSSFADGGLHTIYFISNTSGQIVNFNLDDVSLKNSGLPVSSFGDVPTSYMYSEEIEILYANGFTGGCSASPLLFCPETTMDRAQAAVFMLRGLVGTSYVPPVEPFANPFGDSWSPGPWAQRWAQGMLDQGLTAGCSTSPLLYCPWEQMPRTQAAVFGMRLLNGSSYLPPAGTGTVFADVNGSEWYAGWAEQAYLNGLLPACGSSGGRPLFCPNSLVSRGLGAFMIVRARNLSMP